VTTRVVLATRNEHKVEELRRILGTLPGAGPIDLVGLDAFPGAPEVVETGVTFAENALLKAHGVAAFTGLPAIADDSGLCVHVMGGMPGIFSALWCGRHGDDVANLELLLAQLVDIPDDRRTAHFSCAAALALPAGAEHVFEGRLSGTVVRSPRGERGFGYDPVFVPEGEERTLAQMTAAEKDAISHRGRAFRSLAPRVVGLGSTG
jgi:XTP/dITP diphosphohydrolase